MSFTVAIVGRPNVGKSTLFNRLLEERKAIVDDVSGVTRDRQYGVADWNGKSFNLIDTGGFVPDSTDIFETEIRKQVKIALDEANAVVFMCDAATGITDLDDAASAHHHPVFGTVLVFFFVGWFVDRQLGSTPWFMIAMVVVAIVAQFLKLYYVYSAQMRVLEAQRRDAVHAK